MRLCMDVMVNTKQAGPKACLFFYRRAAQRKMLGKISGSEETYFAHGCVFCRRGCKIVIRDH